MARSSLFAVIGLLVASIGFPAMAALPSSQVWQFMAAGPFDLNSPYTGHDSPAFLNGYVGDTANAWNRMSGAQVQNVAYSIMNDGLTRAAGDNTYGIRSADRATPTGAVVYSNTTGSALGIGMDMTTALKTGVWLGYNTTGNIGLTYQKTALRPKTIMQSCLVGQGIQQADDMAVRFTGFQPGNYRVFVVATSPTDINWLQDISIGTNITATQADKVRLGGDTASYSDYRPQNNWVSGTNYTAKTITVNSAADWITVISGAVTQQDGTAINPWQTGTTYWGYPALNAIQIVKLVTGDADLNGKVDFQDYLALESSFGNTVTHGTGADFDNNGVIDFQDYLALESNFGAGAVVETPEPMTLSLLGLGGLALIRRRK